MDIAAWLSGLGLDQYQDTFAENAIDADVLGELSDEDLKELGVAALGHRRKILAAIKTLLGEEPALPSGGVNATERKRGERRHVAVLFADLVGYTQLTEELGAEAMHDLLDEYFNWLDRIVEQAGGRVDKHIGDCVMGVFGAPVSSGNDAERAVRAAIEIGRTLPEIRQKVGRDIEVHVGLSVGVVVASYLGSGDAAEYAVTGDSVNLASRLGDAAAPGEVLISDGLYQAMIGRLRCEAAEELTVKGFATPVRAWRLVELVETARSQEPFAGRISELRQFSSILDTCKSESRGQVIVLRGEAGIGKTRLSEELEAIAIAAGFAAHRGLVLDFGNETGRDALRVIIREILGLPARPEAGELHSMVDKIISDGIVDRGLEPQLAALLEAPQSESLSALYDAMDVERRISGRGKVISQLLAWATSQQARLLVVEDVHWAQLPLLRGLAQLAAALADCPGVLLFTTRPEGNPLDRAWRSAAGETPFLTFDLNPLSAADAKALCEATLGSEDGAEELILRAGGNPLFLRQLLLHHGKDDSEKVPGTIQSLVQATLDRLSEDDKELIQAASVIGQRVDPALLKEISGRAVSEATALTDQNLLRPQGQDYLFVHALIRDAVYESLLGQTRKDLHLKAAQWFADQDRKLEAEHLALANSPDAPRAFLSAAQEEVGKYHYEAATSLIEKGLSLDPSPNDRFGLQLLAGKTWHDFGRMPEAARAYTEALELASSPIDRCHVLIGLAGVKRIVEESEGALKDLQEAEKVAQGGKFYAERSQICFLRGNLLFPRGDIEGCLQSHSNALDLANKAARMDLQAAALGGLGDAEYMRGNMASAQKRLEECVIIARGENLERTAVANQAQIAHTMVYTSPQDKALAAAYEAIEAARRIGHLRAELNARSAATMALASMLHHEECMSEVELCMALIEHLGALRFRQHLFIFRGKSLHALGRQDEALHVLEEGLQFAHDTGFSFHGPSVASCLALMVSNRQRKLELLKEAEDTIAAGCVGHNQYRVYADGIDVAFSLGDAEMLRHYIERSKVFPPHETVNWTMFQARRGEALLAMLLEGKTERVCASLREVGKEANSLSIHCWTLPDA